MKFERGVAFPDVDELMVREMAADLTYQGTHLTAALRYVSDWSCAIDGGAHVGLWSRVMAGRFGRVLAFEPAPDTFECLQMNTQAYANVRCYQMALGDTPGQCAMQWSDACAARANTGGRYVVPGGDIQTITVDGLALDALGFLKLDVEGSEPLALAGAAETIARCKPVILFENKWHWTHTFGLPKHAVRDLLMTFGYRLVESIGNDQIWGPA